MGKTIEVLAEADGHEIVLKIDQPETGGLAQQKSGNGVF